MHTARSSSIIGLILVLMLCWLAPLGVAADDPIDKGLDYRTFGLGLVPSEGDVPQMDLSTLRLDAQLPSTVDLSSNLPPVRSQGAQSSCVAWALGYYFKTYQERVERGWDVTVSEHQFSPAWIYNQRPVSDCEQDNGMTFWAGLSLLQDSGAATLSVFPYSASDSCTQPSQTAIYQAWDYRIDSFANVFAGTGVADITALKTLLAEGKPFLIGVPVYDSFYDVTASNPVVPRHQSGEQFWGGHAMFVVGYDDARGGFKTVNSWGSGWAAGGYCYLSYDFVRYDAWEAWVMEDYTENLRSVDVSLQAGWNLVSLPVIPQTLDVAELFASVASSVESISVWNTETQSWGHYSPHVPDFANTLDTLDPNDGLWVRVTEDVTLAVRGAPLATSIPLSTGWNLVAYPSESALPVDQALSSIAGTFDQILGYRAESGGVWQSYESSTPIEAASLQTLEPGAGYWIYVSASCTWTVP